MNHYNALKWILIYLELIYRTKFVKCIDSTPTEKIKSNGDKSKADELPLSPDVQNDINTKDPSIESFNKSSFHSSEPHSTPENENSLKNQVQSLSKFQIIDLLDAVVNKLKTVNNNYNIEEDIGSCVKHSSANKHPITLKIKDLYTIDQLDSNEDTTKKIVTYTAKADFAYKVIQINSITIWETSLPNEFVTIAEYDKENKNIKIYKLDGTREKISFQVETSKVSNLFTLNILHKLSSNKFKYEKKNNHDIFTVFESFLIYKIKRGDDIIWDFNDEVYPYEVVVGEKENNQRKIECHFQLRSNVVMIKSKLIDDKEDDTSEKNQNIDSDKKYNNPKQNDDDSDEEEIEDDNLNEEEIEDYESNEEKKSEDNKNYNQEQNPKSSNNINIETKSNQSPLPNNTKNINTVDNSGFGIGWDTSILTTNSNGSKSKSETGSD